MTMTLRGVGDVGRDFRLHGGVKGVWRDSSPGVQFWHVLVLAGRGCWRTYLYLWGHGLTGYSLFSIRT